jgi:hypothetical protein
VEKPEKTGDFRRESVHFREKSADFRAIFSPPENHNPGLQPLCRHRAESRFDL